MSRHVWVLSEYDMDDRTIVAVVEDTDTADAILGTPGFEHLDVNVVPVRTSPPDKHRLYVIYGDGSNGGTRPWYAWPDTPYPAPEFHRGYVDKTTGEEVPWKVVGAGKAADDEWQRRFRQARDEGIGLTDPWPDRLTHPQSSLYQHVWEALLHSDLESGDEFTVALHDNRIEVTKVESHLPVSRQLLDEGGHNDSDD